MNMQMKTLEGYQLSPQQERFFLQPAADATAYRVLCVMLIEGDLNSELLRTVFHQVINRHEILRTSFQRLPGMDFPLQVIAAEGMSVESDYDLSGFDTPQQEARIKELFEEAGEAAYDFERGPLLHLSHLRSSPTKHAILLGLPSACADKAGLRVLVHEIGRAYAALCSGEELLGEPLQYADFSQWQNELLESDEMEEARNYWSEKETPSSSALKLPFETQLVAEPHFKHEFLSMVIDSEMVLSLESLAVRYETSIATVLMACWNILLWRLMKTSPITIGVFFDGRKYEELKGTLGPLGRYLPVGSQLQDSLTFGGLLKQVDMALREASRWQEYFSWQATSETAPESCFLPWCFEFDLGPASDFYAGLRFSIKAERSCIERFKVKLSCEEAGESLRAELHYDGGLFERGDIERVGEQYEGLLAAVRMEPEVAISRLSLVGAGERQKLLVDFNATGKEWEGPGCLHQCFEAQAARTPDGIAVEFGEQQLSYAELNARANQLAHLLVGHGVQADLPVAICLERSAEMVIAMLATLKAGGAYLPLDPGYPEQRLAFMLADSQATLIITQTELAAKLGSPQAAVICLEEEAAVIAEQSSDNLEGRVRPNNLAYVIYTSGSSGRPKGVMIAHQSICNRLLWMIEQYSFRAADQVLQKTPFSFDASVWEFYVPLLSGGRLILAEPGGHQDSGYLVQAIGEYQITALQLVPSMFELFLSESAVGQQCRSLRLMFSGGEALSGEAAQRFGQCCPWSELSNLYGPTEVSIDATYWSCPNERRAGAAELVVPIGKPLANVRIHVLNEAQELVALGEQGEVYIGGAGLARGYLGRADWTAERFVPDPYSERGGERLYRSGDVGRRRGDGVLKFCGRVDEQVKLRGYRIETAEIEAVLKEHEQVQEAVVVAKTAGPQGEKRLIAYVVAGGQTALSERELYQLPNGMSVAHLNKNETDLLYQEIFEEECYLQHGILLEDGACVFDVGANIGLFTLFVNERCRQARVFSFEPIPRTFEKLQANVARYGLAAQLYPYGLAEAAGEAQFTFYPKASAMSGRYANAEEEASVTRTFLERQDQRLREYADELLAERFVGQAVNCPLKTVSQVIEEQQLQRLDLLKIDVEKSELGVLQGIEEEDWSKIKQIVVEVHDEHGRLTAVKQLLASHGYRVVVDQDERLKTTGIFNLYAVRPTRGEGQQRQPGKVSFALRAPQQVDLESLLRHSLSQKLPPYMVPSYIVRLPKLPRLPNGKIDKNILPDPESLRSTYVAPQTATEKRLAEMWSDLLDLDEISTHENFFELGGHSLLATQLIARLREELQVELPLRIMFDGSPTILELATQIDNHLIEQSSVADIAEALKGFDDLSEEEMLAL